jgi:hypothetical protein
VLHGLLQDQCLLVLLIFGGFECVGRDVSYGGPTTHHTQPNQTSQEHRTVKPGRVMGVTASGCSAYLSLVDLTHCPPSPRGLAPCFVMYVHLRWVG